MFAVGFKGIWRRSSPVYGVKPDFSMQVVFESSAQETNACEAVKRLYDDLPLQLIYLNYVVNRWQILPGYKTKFRPEVILSAG